MTSDTLINGKKEQIHCLDIENSDDDEDKPLSSSIEDPQTTPINITETTNEKKLNRLFANSIEIDAELRVFEPKHQVYVSKLDEIESLKATYRKEFYQYKKKISQLQKDVARLQKSYNKKDSEPKKTVTNSNPVNLKSSHSTANLLINRHHSLRVTSPSHLRSLPSVSSSPALDKLVNTLSSVERLNLISDQLKANELYLSRISNTIPGKDRYLKIILGGVDVSILNKADKWTYKQEYEKFKFIITCISLVSSLLIWSLTSPYRAFDALFHFLLVWYYCTLTIRESILVVNGSNINLWWRTHHFIATVATAIHLTWPESASYHTFRTQFFVFSFYLSFVQLLQIYYQRGCLYRLRALGETHDMDITIDGFHRWMFRGLSFLVPFLLAAYSFQLYNAYSLWQLAHAPTTHEWQVYVLSIIFFILFLGNISTTLSVIREKFREKPRPMLLKQKYQSLKAFLSTKYRRRSRSFDQVRRRPQQSSKVEENKKDT